MRYRIQLALTLAYRLLPCRWLWVWHGGSSGAALADIRSSGGISWGAFWEYAWPTSLGEWGTGD